MSDEQRDEREARGQCPDADCLACRMGRLFEEVFDEPPAVRALFAGMLLESGRALLKSVRLELDG